MSGLSQAAADFPLHSNGRDFRIRRSRARRRMRCIAVPASGFPRNWRQPGKRLIFASSGGTVYGRLKQVPVPENAIPKPGPLEVHLKDDHLQYAITWFTLAIAVAIAFLTLFAVVVIAEGQAGAGAAVVAFIAIAALVGAGNALYGRHSHGKKAMDRVRAAQEAQNAAADRAAEARRAVAKADRKGERYCPLDLANQPAWGVAASAIAPLHTTRQVPPDSLIRTTEGCRKVGRKRSL